MKGISAEESFRYLSLLAALRSSCRFYDLHVHPYEILFDRFSYVPSGLPGLFTLPGRSYVPPRPREFTFPETVDFSGGARSRQLPEISAMLLRKVYGCVGERVFTDHMELAALDQVLLLPVPAESDDPSRFESRLSWVESCYPNRDRFLVAGCVPPSLRAGEIPAYLSALQKRHRISAIKCHQVVSGIDLGTGSGREWLETTLAACRELKLPMLLHGGRNNLYWGGSRGNFGSLAHLQKIDFSLSSEPVILAHAGMHRCPLQEIRERWLPLLGRMLKRHANLYVDISGLGFEALKLVLQSVEGDRILFGSDALYIRQWEAVTMTLHALKELGMKLEESFVRLASITPEKTVFKEGIHAEAPHQMASVPGNGEGAVVPGGAEEIALHLLAAGPDSGAGLPRPLGAEAGNQDK